MTNTEQKNILIDRLNAHKKDLATLKDMIIYFANDKQMMKNIRLEYNILIGKIHKLQNDINELN